MGNTSKSFEGNSLYEDIVYIFIYLGNAFSFLEYQLLHHCTYIYISYPDETGSCNNQVHCTNYKHCWNTWVAAVCNFTHCVACMISMTSNSIYLSIYLFTYSSIHSFIHLFIYLFIFSAWWVGCVGKLECLWWKLHEWWCIQSNSWMF